MGEGFFWHWLTRVVPDKGLLNGCVCVCVCARVLADSLGEGLLLSLRHLSGFSNY